MNLNLPFAYRMVASVETDKYTFVVVERKDESHPFVVYRVHPSFTNVNRFDCYYGDYCLTRRSALERLAERMLR